MLLYLSWVETNHTRIINNNIINISAETSKENMFLYYHSLFSDFNSSNIKSEDVYKLQSLVYILKLSESLDKMK